MDEFHGPMAVEYEQGGHRHITGNMSTAFLENDVLPAMRKLGHVIIRVFDAVAEAREKFPPGSRVISEARHPALSGWRGTVTGEYRPAGSGGCYVTVDWDGHGTDRDCPVTWLSLLAKPGESARPEKGS